MERDSAIKFPEGYQKLSPAEPDGGARKNKLRLKNCLPFLVLSVLVLHSMISIWCLKTEVNELQKKVLLLEIKAEVDVQVLESIQKMISSQREEAEEKENSGEGVTSGPLDEQGFPENDPPFQDEEELPLGEDEDNNEDSRFGFKRKREIRDYNESSVEKELGERSKNDTEEKSSRAQKTTPAFTSASTEMSSMERSSEYSSKEKFLPASHRLFASSTRKPHLHRKHRKSRIGSAERFFTETHSTTSTPIQVRQSRTKLTQMHGIDKTLWLQNQKFQQHTSAHGDTITKEEALLKGYGKHLEDVGYEGQASGERLPDALSYNVITIHFSADTSHYSRDRDPHYFGNGRMQIKSEVYKDWKPAHWTQGVSMSKYFHLHQGRVTVSTTGIYLIYAQIQYSNVQEVNGFGVFRNKEVVVQCITTSTHPDKHEIKSNTCGISTTILLQSNDSVCIKDLHHGRYVVLTPEKSYFGLVLLSPFKN